MSDAPGRTVYIPEPARYLLEVSGRVERSYDDIHKAMEAADRHKRLFHYESVRVVDTGTDKLAATHP